MTRFDLLRPAPEISRRPAQQIVPPVIDACHYCGGSDVDDGSTVSLLSGGWAHKACHSAHVLAAIAKAARVIRLGWGSTLGFIVLAALLGCGLAAIVLEVAGA